MHGQTHAHSRNVFMLMQMCFPTSSAPRSLSQYIHPVPATILTQHGNHGDTIQSGETWLRFHRRSVFCRKIPLADLGQRHRIQRWKKSVFPSQVLDEGMAGRDRYIQYPYNSMCRVLASTIWNRDLVDQGILILGYA